jgi:hypothetical protein
LPAGDARRFDSHKRRNTDGAGDASRSLEFNSTIGSLAAAATTVSFAPAVVPHSP